MGVSGHLLIGREPAVWPSFCQPTVRLSNSLVEGITLLAGTVHRRERGREESDAHGTVSIACHTHLSCFPRALICVCQQT